MSIVFRKPLYVFLSGLVALSFYTLIVWIPLRGLLFSILSDSQNSLSANISIAIHLLSSALVDLKAADAWYAVALSVLVGINAALLLFYLKRYGLSRSKMGITSATLGTLSGILGFGCAACGSLFASTLIASLFGVALSSRIPVDGFALQIAGILLLVFSIWRLSHAINKPHTCHIDER